MAAGQTYEQVAYTALGAPAASITFSSIAASWTDLQLVLTGVGSAAALLQLQFNGDTATNYSSRTMSGNRTAVSGASLQTQAQIATVNALSTTVPMTFIADIFQYKNTTPYKTVLIQAAEDASASGNTEVLCGLWRNTAAITQVLIKPASGNLGTGFTAALYGIAAA